MTVPVSAERNDYTGNGATSVYAYGYRITDDDHLLVTVATPAGVETTLTKTTDYTVSGVNVKTGGNITLVNNSQAWLTAGKLTTGWDLTVRHVVPLAQETDVRNQGVYYPEIHEDAFDYLMWSIKQQQDEINRSVKVGETVSGLTITLPSPEDGKAIVWDGSTGAMKNEDFTGPTGPVGPQGPQGIAALGGGVKSDGTVGLVNLAPNGAFENFSAGASALPDGWANHVSPTTPAREGTIKYSGAYSLKMSSAGQSACYLDLITADKDINYWKGKTVTASIWCYGGAAKCGMLIYDTTLGGYVENTLVNTWERITKTYTLDANASAFRIYLYAVDGSAVYYDDLIVVEGESQFAFTPHPKDNQIHGVFTANGVTPVSVPNTSVAITDAIIISLNTVGGTVGVQPHVATITAGTGFTVVCTASDTSIYNYCLLKV